MNEKLAKGANRNMAALQCIHALAGTPRWGKPGTPLLPPHMRSALAHERADDKVCQAVGVPLGTCWGSIPCPMRWSALQYALVNEVVARVRPLLNQPVIAPLLKSDEATRALRLLVTPSMLSYLPMGTRAKRRLVTYFAGRPEALWHTTFSELLELRQIGVLTALDLASGLNAAISDVVHAMAELARLERKQLRGLVPQPAWAPHIRCDDPRFTDLLHLVDIRATIADVLADADLRSKLAPVAEDIVRRVQKIEAMPLEAQLEELLTALLAPQRRRGQRPVTNISERVSAIAARFGITGHEPLTLDETGKLLGVSRERVRQIESKLLDAIEAASPLWVPALMKSLQLIATAVPISDEQVGALLSEHGLAGPQMTGVSLLRIARLLNVEVSQVTGRELFCSGGRLLPVQKDIDLIRAVKIVDRHTATYGMTTLDNVADALGGNGIRPEEDILREVLSKDPRIYFGPGQWVWMATERASGRNGPLCNRVRKILSVNTPINTARLLEGIRRSYRFRHLDVVPNRTALRAFLDASPEFAIEGDIVRPQSPLDYHEELSDVEVAIVEVFRLAGIPAIDRLTLCELAEDNGINRNSLNVKITYAPFIENFGRNIWGLRGAHVRPADIEIAKDWARRRRKDESAEVNCSWIPEGGIRITFRLTTSLFFSGAVTLPTYVTDYLAGHEIGLASQQDGKKVIRTSAHHSFMWGWRDVVLAAGAKVGDVIVFDTDLVSDTATLRIGTAEDISGESGSVQRTARRSHTDE